MSIYTRPDPSISRPMHSRCSECGEEFTSSVAFEQHQEVRVPGNPNRRWCLTPVDLRAKGLTQNAWDQWEAAPAAVPVEGRGC
jgi:hypothetical protein